jgi:GNAT superfamily N-acetyltransferase
VKIRQATVADAAQLALLARDTFVDTFAAANTASDMEMYVAMSFGEAIQRAELSDPRTTVFVADAGGALVGYALLHDGPVPECVTSDNVLEIDRLYVAKSHLGTGLGAALMRRCLDEAADRGKELVWLNVWERNLPAMRFYERWGFQYAGTMPYVLGTDHQTDHVMIFHLERGDN